MGSQEDHSTWQYLQNARETYPTDFTIICPSGKVGVHKMILALRSEYFRTLFSKPDRYVENEKNQLDLHDDKDVDVGCMKALIEILYTNKLPAQPMSKPPASPTVKTPARSTIKPPAQPTAKTLAQPSQAQSPMEYHLGISTLADRFLIKGIDNLIADLIYDCFNDTNSATTPGKGRQLRTDKPFLDATKVILENAGRNDSPKAKTKIAALFNDHLHCIKRVKGVQEWLLSQPILTAELLSEQMEGQERLMCPQCGVVQRVSPRSLTTGTKYYGRGYHSGDAQVKCTRCSCSTEKMSAWRKKWFCEPA